MNRSFHKPLLLAAALSAISVTVQAAPLGGHPWAADRVEVRVTRMAEQLDLTETQEADIRALLQQHHQEQDRQRQALRDQIDGLLTPAQQAMRDEQRQARMERRLDRMTERLELTDAQRTQIAALMEDKRANPDLDRAEMRERMAAVLTTDQAEALRSLRGRPGQGRRGRCGAMDGK